MTSRNSSRSLEAYGCRIALICTHIDFQQQKPTHLFDMSPCLIGSIDSSLKLSSMQNTTHEQY